VFLLFLDYGAESYILFYGTRGQMHDWEVFGVLDGIRRLAQGKPRDGVCLSGMRRCFFLMRAKREGSAWFDMHVTLL
jgi:hypothetical protein